MNYSSSVAIFSKLPLVLGATDDSAGAGIIFAFLCCYLFFVLALVIVSIAGMYKVLEKAGQPGWYALIPYLNSCAIAHIAKRPWWWGLIPFLNLWPLFELAKKFGKSDAYGVGLVFLSFVFLPMLGFGQAQYIEEKPQPLF